MIWQSTTQRGVALVQVLLLTMVLTVILLSMNYQAKQSIRLASAVAEYNSASLQVHSAEAEVMFEMLTNVWYHLTQSNSSQEWNFHGEPFLLKGADVEIQDTAGLINVRSPDADLLAKYTELYFGNAEIGTKLAAAIRDWQDPDNIESYRGAEQADYPAEIRVRNDTIQYMQEIKHIKGMSEPLYQALTNELTLFPRGVNLNQQPRKIWQLYMQPEQVEELSRQRRNGNLQTELYEAFSGKQIDEFNRFGFGPAFRIRISVTEDDVVLRRELTVRFTPYQQQPFEIYEYKQRNTDVGGMNAE